MQQAILSFNAGEVSPYLRHRIDFEKTSSSAEEMENFLAMPYGGVIKRPGLEYLATVADAGVNSRLLPFLAADGSRYLLHFTAGWLSIYGVDGSLKTTLPFLAGYAWPGTPDFQNSLRTLQIVQLNDVAFITHAATFPLRLSRFSDVLWTLEYVPFTKAPMLDDNLEVDATWSVAGNPVADPWSEHGTYDAGDYCFTTSEWECIVTHLLAPADSKPGVGANWRLYWKRRLFAAGDRVSLVAAARSTTAWDLLPHQYSAHEVRYYQEGETRQYMISNRAHGATLVPDAEDGFVAGHDWALLLWWGVDDAPDFEIGVGMYRVVVNGYGDRTIYQCTEVHQWDDLPLVTKPGEGSDWGAWWSLVGVLPAIVPNWFLSDYYSPGMRRSNDGGLYECYRLHIPVAGNEPGIEGNDWTDYWRRLYAFAASESLQHNSPGTYYRIAPERDSKDNQIEIVANLANHGMHSPEIVVEGDWDFFTYGHWFGTFHVERSIDGGSTWAVVRSYQGSDDRNVADAGVEDAPSHLRIRFESESGTLETHTGRAVLIPQLPYVTGYVLMTEQTRETELHGIATTPVLSGSTWRWAEGAFSVTQGFPTAIALHDARLWLAATASQPVSLWASQTDDLTNFETGVEATDGIFATLALSASSPIRWLASQRRLFVGTAHGEWVVGSETTEATVSPTNFMARQYSGYGTATVTPLIANDAVFFCERKGTRLRELGYSAERESYDAADLSRLAEHITRAGISNFAWQQTREPGLWVVRRDGVLLHFAYSRQERISAWSRHTTAGGLVRDVACLPSDDGDDEVFFIVDRGNDSCLERFPQHWQAAQEAGSGWFHLDGVSGTGTSIALPAHLLGVPITVMQDGVAETLTQATSPLTISPSASWQAGLPVVSRLVGLPIDTTARDGTTQARRKRTCKLLLSLYQSAGGHLYNVAESRKQAIANTRPATTLRTGWEETIPDAGALDDLQLRLYHADPFPFCLRAAVMRWHLHES